MASRSSALTLSGKSADSTLSSQRRARQEKSAQHNEASIKFTFLCPSHAPTRIAHNIHWNNHYYKILSEDMTWHRVAKRYWSPRANMIIHQGVSMSELCTVSRLHKSEKQVASDGLNLALFCQYLFANRHNTAALTTNRCPSPSDSRIRTATGSSPSTARST